MRARLLKCGTQRTLSHTTTMAWIAFSIVSLSFLGGILGNLTIGDFTLELAYPDAGLVAAFLTPVFGLYGYRRKTESDEMRERTRK